MTQSTPEKEWLPFHRTAILRKHLLMCIPASSGTPSGLVTACTSWPGYAVDNHFNPAPQRCLRHGDRRGTTP